MTVDFRPLDLATDLDALHAWVTHPRSHFWGMQGASRADVAREYAAIASMPHHDALIGSVDGVPQLLLEQYSPGHSELAGLPELEAGDLGMHVLVAPPDRPRHGFTRDAFAAVMRRCFADPSVARVVVEPDVRNTGIRRLNKEAGFEELREVELQGPPAKTAALSVCPRAAFAASPLGATA